MRRAFWFGFVIVALLAVVLSPVAPADAAATCALSMNASSRDELADAIACYNLATEPGTYEIVLTADISYSAGQVVPEITNGSFEISSEIALVIYGLGHTVSGPGGLVVGENLFSVSGIALFTNIVIDRSAYRGIDAKPGAKGAITSSTISGSGGTALYLDGANFTVTNSTLSDSGIAGAYVGPGSSLTLSASTLSGSATRGVLVAGGGAFLMYDSTVSGYAIEGVYAADGASVNIWRSTIVGPGLDGIRIDGGVTQVLSSLVVDGCTGPLSDSQKNQIGSGGTCGSETLILTPAPAPLDDNGCAAPSPLTCVKTHAIFAGSSAVDAGSCDSVFFDQRGIGFPRAAGPTCDAGAFEAIVLCDGKPVTIDLNQFPGSNGTSGPDVILGTAGPDVVDGFAGDDTICGLAGDDVLVGGEGDDRIFGDDGADVARGNQGRDYLDGGLGNDRLLGGIDDDELVGGDGNDFLGGFGGDDLISGGAGDETIFGGFGADRLFGDEGDDVIRGLIGNDSIFGGPGNDVLDGDRGNDFMSGGDGADVMNGGNARDQLFGDDGDDHVSGGRADDQLSGGSGTDVCVGNLHDIADTTDGTCETVFGVP